MNYFICLLKLIAVSLFLVVIFIHCRHKYVEYHKYMSASGLLVIGMDFCYTLTLKERFSFYIP